jgi:hypothetical protein
MIDLISFSWDEIFGVVKSTDGLVRPQTRGLRTEIQEIATAKYSNGLLKYVGMAEYGRDYVDIHGEYWEDKGKKGMFPKNGKRTKSFVLKNFQSNKTEYVKTFDYILLKDTENMSVAWATWDSVHKNVKIRDATVESYVSYDDLHMICSNVIPKNKEDFCVLLDKIIEELI